ncbi:MAG: hypothetical protein COW30_02025 [Rhodospirillales bacterium CG15_BIG_FIL_POST_REV_8_21_14_020_66_15]|nr:MAG: hypothetical protein COW30_02025 [Rhodospirillales bacterium CG15_BIG_FIL_POST_REV_8_21_14_020_66_15]
MAEFAAVALSTAVSSGLSAIQQQAAAKQQAAQVEAQRRQQVAQIQQQQEIETRRKREQLRQAQAAQRARFAGSGISAAGGSAASLLTGLARQVDQAIADGDSLNRLRIDGINSAAAAQRSSLLSTPRNTLLSGFSNILTSGIRRTPSLFDEPSPADLLRNIPTATI